jgi:ribonuclease G
MSSKELVISSNRHETRLAILEDDQLVEVYFQRANEYSLAGSIHKGRVTRVLPGMQSAFVDLGLERDTFLYVSDFYEEHSEDIDKVTGGAEERPARRDEERGGGRGGRGGDRRERGGRGRDRGGRGGGRDRGPASQEAAAPAGEAPEYAEAAAPAEYESALPVAAHEAYDEIPEAVEYDAAAIEEAGGEEVEGVAVEAEASGETPSQEGATVAAAAAGQPQRHEGGRGDRRDRGGDRDGRGRRGRRRGRGRGRGFPDSKYAQPGAGEEEGDSQADIDAGPEEATPVSAIEQPAEPAGEVFLLPGESLRKYRGAAVPPPLPVMETASAAKAAPEPEEEEEVDEAAAMVAGPVDTAELTLAAEDPMEHPSANALPDAPLHPERAAEPPVEYVTAEEILDSESIDEEPVAAATVVDEEVETVATEDEAVEAAAGEGEEEELSAVEGSDDEDPEIQAMIFGEVSGEEGAEGVNLDEVQEEAERTAATLPVNVQLRDRSNQRFLRQDGGRRQRGRRGRGRDRGERGERGGGDRHPQQQQPAVEGQELVAGAGAAPAPAAEEQQQPRQPQPATQQPHRHERGGNGGGAGHDRAMPLISDLLKEGQEIIVQIAKEPLGQKGARITSHIALPGRYVVFMPTLDHMGVSRKIASDEERHRLKRILQGIRGSIQGGCIIRTAGEGKPDDEIIADIQFLHNLWQDIKQKADKRQAPLLLHHDLDIVQRILRDQVNESYKAVWVDNEEMYESILRFVQRFQPNLLSKVKLYTRSTPIFDAFNISNELEKALRPKVWLKSGGYIVINQTEALVAIDINTGKFVGKSNRLEDTIVKTNLEAVKEIVRQVRLRDLGGIIVIDFIDMDERKNRQKVMQALEEAMRQDRAPYKILQFNDFGLVAVTRKRVKQSLERTLCSPCPYCEGAGYVKSVPTIVSEILLEAQKLAQVIDHSDVVLRCNPEVAKMFKSHHNEYLEEIEEILKRPVLVKSDPALHQEKFDLA